MTTYTWIGHAGSWEYAPNWSPAGVPGGGDNAFITASGTYTVTEDKESIHDLTTSSNATLSIGHSLQVLGTIDNSGTIELANPAELNASLVAHGPFNNSGTLEVLDGNVEVQGAFDNLGTIALGNHGYILFRHKLSTAQLGNVQADSGGLSFYGILDNTGAIFVAPDGVGVSGSITGGTIAGPVVLANFGFLDDSLTLTNTVFTGAGGLGRGFIDATADGASLFLGSSNSGALEMIANVTIDVGQAGAHDGASVSADGVAASTTINATGLTWVGTDLNEGTINANGAGSVTYLDRARSASFINEGSLLIGSGVAGFIEALSFVNSGDISVAGTLTLASGSAFATGDTGMPNPLAKESYIGGTIGGAGEFVITHVSATILHGAALSIASWSLAGAGTVVTMGAYLTYAGHFSLGAGTALSLTLGNLTLTGTADLAGGRIDGARRLDTAGTTAVSGLTIGPTCVWINTGTATQNGDDVMISDASGAPAILYNGASGVYAISDDTGIGLGVSPDSYLNNVGLFEKTGGAGTSVIAANTYNTGTIEVSTGTLDFHRALWGPGQSEVGAGATLEVDGEVGGRSILAFSGAGGVIALDDLAAAGVNLFHGSISGFGAGDAIDLGAPFGTGTTARFVEFNGGAGGELILRNAAVSASVTMLGDYSTGNFTPSDDGHGGTLLTFHA